MRVMIGITANTMPSGVLDLVMAQRVRTGAPDYVTGVILITRTAFSVVVPSVSLT